MSRTSSAYENVSRNRMEQLNVDRQQLAQRLSGSSSAASSLSGRPPSPEDRHPDHLHNERLALAADIAGGSHHVQARSHVRRSSGRASMASSLPAHTQNGRFERELAETRAHMAAVRAPVPPHISDHKLATGLGLGNLRDILGDNPEDSSAASSARDARYAYDDRFAATDPGGLVGAADHGTTNDFGAASTVGVLQAHEPLPPPPGQEPTSSSYASGVAGASAGAAATSLAMSSSQTLGNGDGLSCSDAWQKLAQLTEQADQMVSLVKNHVPEPLGQKYQGLFEDMKKDRQKDALAKMAKVFGGLLERTSYDKWRWWSDTGWALERAEKEKEEQRRQLQMKALTKLFHSCQHGIQRMGLTRLRWKVLGWKIMRWFNSVVRPLRNLNNYVERQTSNQLRNALTQWAGAVDVPAVIGGPEPSESSLVNVLARAKGRWQAEGFRIFKLHTSVRTAKTWDPVGQEQGTTWAPARVPFGQLHDNGNGVTLSGGKRGGSGAGGTVSDASAQSHPHAPYRLGSSGSGGAATSNPGTREVASMRGGGGRYVYNYDGKELVKGLAPQEQAASGATRVNRATLETVLDWQADEVTHWMFEQVVPDIPLARRQKALLEGRHLLSLSDESLCGAAGAMLLPGTPLFFASEENRAKVLSRLGQLRGAAVRQVHANPMHQPSVVVDRWGPEHVAWWLAVHAGFGKCVDAVWLHLIDGPKLLTFREDDLENTFGMHSRKKRQALLRHIAELSSRSLPHSAGDGGNDADEAHAAAQQMRHEGGGAQRMLSQLGIGSTDLAALTTSELVRLRPTAVANWVSDVLKLPQYRQIFEEEGVDGTKLLQLTDKQLRIDLQIPSRTHRQKIMASIMELKHRQAVLQSESLDGRSRTRKMPKHYEALQDEANVQPLILLLQDRHQINMQEAPPAALAAARKRELDYQMWKAGVDSFAGSGPRPGANPKVKPRWPPMVQETLTRLCRAVGASALTLPEVFEAFKAHSNSSAKLKREELALVLRQMGMAPSVEQVELILGTIRGKGASGAQTGVGFWDFVTFFEYALASRPQGAAASPSQAVPAPPAPQVPVR